MNDYSPARVRRLVNLAQKHFEMAVDAANRAERSADTASKFGKSPGGYKRALRALADAQYNSARAHSYAWMVRDSIGNETHPEFLHAIDAARQAKEEVRRAELAVDDAGAEYQIANPNRSLPRF